MKALLAEITAYVIALVVFMMLLSTAGCTGLTQMSDDWCEAHLQAGPSQCWWRQNPTLSMDQANLKQHDHGCPSAVFIAPHGELEQCND